MSKSIGSDKTSSIDDSLRSACAKHSATTRILIITSKSVCEGYRVTVDRGCSLRIQMRRAIAIAEKNLIWTQNIVLDASEIKLKIDGNVLAKEVAAN